MTGRKLREQPQIAHMTMNENFMFANGCMDVLHAGHCRFLQFCIDLKCFCGIKKFVLALDSDKKIKNDKGPTRPIFSFEERRKAVMEAFPEIDVVISFDTNEELASHIKRYNPVLIKGERWEGNVVGGEHASQIVYCRDFDLPSTTEIEQRIRKIYLKELKEKYPGAELL